MTNRRDSYVSSTTTNEKEQINNVYSSKCVIKSLPIDQRPSCGGISLRYLLSDDFLNIVNHFEPRHKFVSTTSSWLSSCFPFKKTKKIDELKQEYDQFGDIYENKTHEQLTMNDLFALFIRPFLRQRHVVVNNENKKMKNMKSRYSSFFDYLKSNQPNAVKDVADWYICYSHTTFCKTFFRVLDSSLLQSINAQDDVFVFIDILCHDDKTITNTCPIFKSASNASISHAIYKEMNHNLELWSDKLMYRLSTIGKFISLFDFLPPESSVKKMQKLPMLLPSGKVIIEKQQRHQQQRESPTNNNGLRIDSFETNKIGSSPATPTGRIDDWKRIIPLLNVEKNRQNPQVSPGSTLENKKELSIAIQNQQQKQHQQVEEHSMSPAAFECALAKSWLNCESLKQIPSVFSSKRCLWEMYIASKLSKSSPESFTFQLGFDFNRHYDFLYAIIHSPRAVITRFQKIVSFNYAIESHKGINDMLLQLAHSCLYGVSEVESAIVDSIRQWVVRKSIITANAIITHPIELLDQYDNKLAFTEEHQFNENHVYEPCYTSQLDRDVSKLSFSSSLLFEEEGLSGNTLDFINLATNNIKNAFGNKSAETAIAFLALGGFQRREKDYSNAIESYKLAISIWKDVSPSRYQFAIAIAHCNLGYCQRARELKDDSNCAYSIACSIWKSCLSEKMIMMKGYEHSSFLHQEIKFILEILSTMYIITGNYEEALAYYLKLAECEEQQFGTTLTIIENLKIKTKLMNLLCKCSKYDQAGKINKDVTDILLSLFGSSSQEYENHVKIWEMVVSNQHHKEIGADDFKLDGTFSQGTPNNVSHPNILAETLLQS